MIRLGRSLLNQPIADLVKQNKQVTEILKRSNSTFIKSNILNNRRTPSYYQVRNKA
jgi:hypothetical protein